MKIVNIVGGTIVTGLGLAAIIGNPSERTYSEYATQHLSTYLEKAVCPSLSGQVPRWLDAENICRQAFEIKALNPLIKDTIINSTERKNFLFFSLYETELSAQKLLNRIPRGLPVPVLSAETYTFKTVGAAGRFYIYAIDLAEQPTFELEGKL